MLPADLLPLLPAVVAGQLARAQADLRASTWRSVVEGVPLKMLDAVWQSSMWPELKLPKVMATEVIDAAVLADGGYACIDSHQHLVMNGSDTGRRYITELYVSPKRTAVAAMSHPPYRVYLYKADGTFLGCQFGGHALMTGWVSETDYILKNGSRFFRYSRRERLADWPSVSDSPLFHTAEGRVFEIDDPATCVIYDVDGRVLARVDMGNGVPGALEPGILWVSLYGSVQEMNMLGDVLMSYPVDGAIYAMSAEGNVVAVVVTRESEAFGLMTSGYWVVLFRRGDPRPQRTIRCPGYVSRDVRIVQGEVYVQSWTTSFKITP